MTISVWRYSHLVLAISSFLLIALASITGIILAFEPVSLKTLPYKVDNFNQITLAETLPVLKNNFEEITDLTVDHNQFVIVKGINTAGNDVTVYVDPRNGKTLGVPEKQNEFFQWVTSFHRSLFLNELGRFFIGLTAFLLLLITVSGIALIIQRQRGIKRFFTKIIRENFFQYYHVTLGRILLIPILIITISGTYLSLVRFKIIPEHKVSSKVDFDSIKSDPEKKLADFTIFKNTTLGEVNNIEFPFSEDVEDYYTLKLKDRELTVNQITGDILTEALYPTTVLLTELSLDLHTGRTNIIWAIVLAIASCNILFFIYSGFAITLKRRSGVTKNKYKKEDCNYIILVGSENGSTFHFAKSVYQQLIKVGQKCFIAELNNYSVYPKAEYLIVFTATYGLGDAPTNASKFMELLKKHPQPNKVDFSVVGFGSKSYPDFCKYAYEANNVLSLQEWAASLIEIHTVNDRSPEEFGQWAELWSQKTEIPLAISPKLFAGKAKRLHKLVVTEKTIITHEEGSFLIHLKPKRTLRFTSGDLLAIYPANDHRERLYSIGKVNKNLQLSVKLHKNGLGSNYLYDLQPGQIIKAAVDVNAHFHFPKKASTVIMIANGTGIAPFLGMVDGNHKKINTHLYCGFRDSSSFELYKDATHKNLEKKKLSSLNLSYSREGNKQYVSDLVLRDKELIAKAMQQDGVIMICGSLAMQKDIIEILEVIFKETNNQEVSYYQSHNRILMDCY
ncbi:FAD-binding oxidoreductase [Pedobacter frigiditerrae]|uniref:NADPH--hemoprotein reductase n=1 Tax=Pedobacter frigiditerrae TaxID=2530452 RepID=A0A4R0MTE2_9SPHI|nr:PepSY domain-containing protein [Pedobacter frigiditerrae]TCC90318.1 FAD-binding oxidoreductase [Pedobacter frigiditerrae]